MTPDIYFPNLGIEFGNVSRVMVTIFGFSIYWYGVLITTGIFMGYLTAQIEAKRSGQKSSDYSDLLIYSVASAFIGLRLFYVAFNWDLYRHNPLTIITGIRSGGLAIFGGLIASIICLYVFGKVRKIDPWLILDTCAPSFALGQAIGRWGNFFNREAFGTFTDNIFAMRLASHQVTAPVTSEILANTAISNGIEYFQVHPTFLYESIWSLAAFALLTLYRPRKKFSGEVFWLFLMSYGFVRFFVEILRTDQLLAGSIPVSQLTAMLMFLVALGAISSQRLLLRRNAR